MKLSTFSKLCLLASFSSAAGAQQCWRDTPCTGPDKASFPGPWDSDNFSPESRTTIPGRVLSENHDVLSPWPSPATLQGNGSMLIFDFEKEVGGSLTIKYTACGAGSLGIAYSEARNFTGYNSDESNGGSGPDGAMFVPIDASQCNTELTYTTPDEKQRGGFRYLTLFAMSNDPAIQVDLKAIDLEISFQPNWPNLRAYQGYFHSSDELLNRIWYAGAYTIQTTTIASNAGREYPLLNVGWLNDAQLGTDAPTVIVDGAKRDRAIWAGDLGIATRSALVSTGDLDSVKNALEVQYTHQQASGELPMVGPPINFISSDTYHMSTLIGTYDYVLFSGDMQFLTANWASAKRAISFVSTKIDSTGMMNVNGPNNWGRSAISNGHTTDGNMLLYRTLITGAAMAQWQSDPDLATQYISLAEALKAAVNQYNWDVDTGSFKNTDNDASVHPEDGNSMAVYYNGTRSEYASSISAYLETNWGPVGAVTPELPGNVVPYIESFEIKAHLEAREATRALKLMRLSWGWYLNNPYGTQSTCLEGYYTDGSFRYRDDGYNKGGSYTSHAHGWSTGPTDALTSYVVGLRPTSPGGRKWLVEPQFGDLSHAQGGFTLPLGKFSSSWAMTEMGYEVSINVPCSTSGMVRLPLPGDGSQAFTVMVRGQEVNYYLDDGGKIIAMAVKGGRHTVTVTTKG